MKVGFIGTGNMGGAIAKVVAKACPKATFYLADPSSEKAEALKAAMTEIKTSRKVQDAESTVLITDNHTLADTADYIYLAVKPQIMPTVLEDIRETLAARFARGEHFVLVTMAAGVPAEKIQILSEGYYPVVRIMPNTPVELSEGCVAYTGLGTSEKDLRGFVRLMKYAGTLLQVAEEKIDAVCALSGCGPAYVYMFLNALIEEGKKLDLTEDEARALAAQTLRGAAAMVTAGKGTPEELRIKVCSPGGATIEGVKKLQEGNLEELVMTAVKAGYDRTLQLK